jgi:adenylate cyclase
MLIDPDNITMKYNFACVLAAYVGDKAEALRLLAQALSCGGTMMFKVAESDPDLDCLRDDSEFQKLMERERRRHGLDAAAPIQLANSKAGRSA